MGRGAGLAAVAVLMAIVHSATAQGQQTKPLVFVREYVREVSEIERLRQRGENDLKAGGEQMANCVRNMTSLQIEYRIQTGMMKRMALPGQFKELPVRIAQVYEMKSGYLGKYIEVCSAMLARPQPGVDYGKLVAEAPKITANLDALDHTQFEMTPLLFAMLIDMRPDKAGHASHLNITNAERADLVEEIDRRFGDNLKPDETSPPVSSMAGLRILLLNGHKGSDEPW